MSSMYRRPSISWPRPARLIAVPGPIRKRYAKTDFECLIRGRPRTIIQDACAAGRVRGSGGVATVIAAALNADGGRMSAAMQQTSR